MSLDLLMRPRRLRHTPERRDLVEETTLHPRNLVMPYFLLEGTERKEAMKTLPGLSRLSLDYLLKEIERGLALGIKSALIFPSLSESSKSADARAAYDEDGLYPKSLRQIKKEFPELCLMTDVALDPYSTEGHDGLVKDGQIINDETVAVLEKMAVVHAACGVDFIAPSDMMDGRVCALRKALDRAGHINVGIVSYTAKYASQLYGPFREALDSAPRFGDKKTYQMNPANRREAMRELMLDQSEGADIVMVKPALFYLDVISDFKKKSNVPVAAYNVSGEYAMIKFAAQSGAFDEAKARDEMLLSIRRAGADLIFTYFALDFARDWKASQK